VDSDDSTTAVVITVYGVQLAGADLLMVVHLDDKPYLAWLAEICEDERAAWDDRRWLKSVKYMSPERRAVLFTPPRIWQACELTDERALVTDEAWTAVALYDSAGYGLYDVGSLRMEAKPDRGTRRGKFLGLDGARLLIYAPASQAPLLRAMRAVIYRACFQHMDRSEALHGEHVE
jgi:hypothetical protein